MTALIEFRERIRRLYANSGRFVNAGAAFLLIVLTLFMTAATLGYKGPFSSLVIVLAIALIMCFMPHSAILTMLLGVIGYEIYTVGLEAAIVYAALCLVFIAIYFIFKPGKSYCMSLAIVLGLAQFFGPMPVIAGLIFTPFYSIPMCMGIIVSSFVTYVAGNTGMYAASSSLSISKKILSTATGVFLDESLWINIFLLAGVTIIVYLIRKLSARRSWVIAVITGCICTFLLSILVSTVLGDPVNYLVLTINVLLEAVTGVVLIFFFFMVDYSREEILQFEDDEYVYFVKAVPKLSVAIQDMKVTRIKAHNIKNITRTSDNVTFVRENTDTTSSPDDKRQLPPPEDTLTDVPGRKEEDAAEETFDRAKEENTADTPSPEKDEGAEEVYSDTIQ